MLTALSKGTNIILTAAGAACCFFILQGSGFFEVFRTLLIAALLIFPATVLLLFRIYRHAEQVNLPRSRRAVLLVAAALVFLLSTGFLVEMILIEGHAYKWIHLGLYGSDGYERLDQQIGAAGLCMLVCSACTIYLKPGAGRYRSLFTALPLVIHLLLLVLVICATKTTSGFTPDTGG
jgi:hypothetical protein